MKVHLIKSLIIFTLSLVSQFLFSCNSERLGRNFYYLSDVEALDIGYPFGSMIYSSKHKNWFDSIYVTHEILNMVNSNQYIHVLQRPNIKLYEEYLFNRLKYKDFDNYGTQFFSASEMSRFKNSILNGLKSRPDTMLVIQEQLRIFIAKSPSLDRIYDSDTNYYLIAKKKGELMGPFSKSAYSQQCKLLDIRVRL